MGTRDALLALGRRLQAAGYQVGENPAFGGVNPVHTKNSAHYSGDALDINYDGRGQSVETTKLQAVVGLAKAAGLRVIWQTVGHFDHIHVDDRPGPDIGRIGYTGPATSSIPAPQLEAATTTASLGPSMDDVGNTVIKATIIGLAVMGGAGLVLLGFNKVAGDPVGKAINTIAI